MAESQQNKSSSAMSSKLVRDVAEKVYAMLLADLRLEKEHRRFSQRSRPTRGKVR
jgi:hypothetical protein